jgi:hypothetical protein
MSRSDTPEGRIKAACLSYLERRHIRAWNNPTGAVRIADRWVHLGKKGSADIIGLLPEGRFLAVEVKPRTAGCPRNRNSFLPMSEARAGLPYA